MAIDLSLVIVNFNTRELTINCIESIQKNTKNVKYEIIVIDNGSTEKFQISNSKFQIKFIKNKENLGFARANNQGISEACRSRDESAKPKYVLLLNSDTLIYDNVLGEMVSWMDESKEIGIASCALKNKDGSLQLTGGYFPTLSRVFSWMLIQDLPFMENIFKQFHPKTGYDKYHEQDWVTGAFMLMRREVIDKIGYLSEDYFMYTEDTDFCYQAKKANYKVVYNPSWSITHFGGSSSVREFPLLSEYKGVKLFYRKHYPRWQYPALRILLKLGSLWRIFLISPKIYAKAFREA